MMRTGTRLRLRPPLVATAALALIVGCAQAPEPVVVERAEPCERGSVVTGTESVLGLTFDELRLTPSAEGIEPADTVVVVVENRGDVAHELMIVRGTVDDVFERGPDGALPRFGPGRAEGRIVASLDDVPPGLRCELHLDMEPGTYTAFSNRVVDGVPYADSGGLVRFLVIGEIEGPGGPPATRGG
jgi:hypothetical protein